MPTERGNSENGQRDGIESEKSDQKHPQQKRTVEGPGSCLDPGDISETARKGAEKKGPGEPWRLKDGVKMAGKRTAGDIVFAIKIEHLGEIGALYLLKDQTGVKPGKRQTADLQLY